jgi:membrane-bound lytic murein transglycosylase F
MNTDRILKSLNVNFLIALLAIFAWSCNTQTNVNDDDGSQRDKISTKRKASKEIYTLEPGKLTVLVDNSIASYFILKGEPLGFEYEMLKMFAQDHGLELKIKVVYDVDHILDSLIENKGDVAAANLTISRQRTELVSFTKPLFRTQQVLVQRLPDDKGHLTRDQIRDQLITDRLDLAGKQVHVRPNSSFHLRLKNFVEETNTKLTIDTVSGDMVTEKLVEMVADGAIDYTLSDANKAQMMSLFFDNIDITTPMSLSQPIGWAVNKNAPLLLDSLNRWISNSKGSLTYNVVWNKYFETKGKKVRSVKQNFEEVKKGVISPYDDLIEKYARQNQWDWRLLASQVYQESGFDPDVRSWQGAVGLMQVLPSTASMYGVSGAALLQPEHNIRAGTDHLKFLLDFWKKHLTDSLEIMKFSLASYNTGLGHVLDARRLAAKYDKDPDVFDGNVSEMLKNKAYPRYFRDAVVKYGYCRGTEPVNYVEEILDRYALYQEYTENSARASSAASNQKTVLTSANTNKYPLAGR